MFERAEHVFTFPHPARWPRQYQAVVAWILRGIAVAKGDTHWFERMQLEIAEVRATFSWLNPRRLLGEALPNQPCCRLFDDVQGLRLLQRWDLLRLAGPCMLMWQRRIVSIFSGREKPWQASHEFGERTLVQTTSIAVLRHAKHCLHFLPLTRAALEVSLSCKGASYGPMPF